jgi:hypothetical protein
VTRWAKRRDPVGGATWSRERSDVARSDSPSALATEVNVFSRISRNRSRDPTGTLGKHGTPRPRHAETRWVRARDLLLAAPTAPPLIAVRLWIFDASGDGSWRAPIGGRVVDLALHHVRDSPSKSATVRINRERHPAGGRMRPSSGLPSKVNLPR